MKQLSLIAPWIVGASLFSTSAALTAPSPGIEKLLSTPASTFDVFLQRLYWAANGSTFFGGPTMKETLRIFDLKYDYDSNLITMKFHISPDHKSMSGFTEASLIGKREILIQATKDLAESLGVAPREEGLRVGLIQALELRYGWSTKDLDEQRVREEIADRTQVEVIYAYEPKLLYAVRRTHLGEFEFSAAPRVMDR